MAFQAYPFKGDTYKWNLVEVKDGIKWSNFEHTSIHPSVY